MTTPKDCTQDTCRWKVHGDSDPCSAPDLTSEWIEPIGGTTPVRNTQRGQNTRPHEPSEPSHVLVRGVSLQLMRRLPNNEPIGECETCDHGANIPGSDHLFRIIPPQPQLYGRMSSGAIFLSSSLCIAATGHHLVGSLYHPRAESEGDALAMAVPVLNTSVSVQPTAAAPPSDALLSCGNSLFVSLASATS